MPTCTRDGSTLYTCSICGETKSETLPALGHSWQVKQSVSTQYDESGTLIQEGYTLYECTVCQEQYKDSEGTGPPQSPGQEKESLWEKIGKLLGSIFGGFVGLIEAALGKVLDALTALCELLLDKLGAVVETILSVLEESGVAVSGIISADNPLDLTLEPAPLEIIGMDKLLKQTAAMQQLQTLIQQTLDHPVLTTSFADYTVTEGLLLLLLLFFFLKACADMLRRAFSWLL